MRDRVVESIQEIKRLYMSRKNSFSSPDPEIFSKIDIEFLKGLL